ncbi:hypothetical protein ACFFMN_12870 [Planobispora siamensis]|uniref:Uncharacterized protein n=1 Tax=Planobispora siamensis TaxID=936338 RepID=A0A8J3WHS9_9ACTN|nr:hypothetical protein [Planobispora siamensis]GIH89750.1 hypothetical protein Psi01_03800 [Planobispora siamensis]
MRRNVRTAWITVGGALTALAVLVLPVTVWTETRPPGSIHDTSLLSSTASESSVQVYRLTSPVIVVLASGEVEVQVVPGETGRLTVERTITWSRERPGLFESWDGTILQAQLSCPESGRAAEPNCRARYTLRVPDGIRVEGLGSPPGG